MGVGYVVPKVIGGERGKMSFSAGFKGGDRVAEQDGRNGFQNGHVHRGSGCGRTVCGWHGAISRCCQHNNGVKHAGRHSS